MADEKPIEPITLVATERGFYRGSMVEVGKEFAYFGAKIPKWAVVKGTKLPAKSVKPIAGDTKPEEARAAVKRKASGMTGDV